MARDAFGIPSKKLVVFWSRKSGNTSLTDWIADIMLADEEDRPRIRQRAMKSADFHIDYETALKLIKEEDYEDFILARNPYARIVSSYVEKFIHYRDRPMDQLSELKRFSMRAFLEIMEMKGKPSSPGDYADAYPGISFVDFLELIKAKVHDRETNGGEPDLNGHWNTQVPFFYDGKLTYSNVIRLERLPDAAAPLAAKLGTEIPFPHRRANVVEKAVAPKASEDLSTTPSVELIKAGLLPDASSLLNETTRKLIQDAFEIDFRMLGYGIEEVPSAKRTA